MVWLICSRCENYSPDIYCIQVAVGPGKSHIKMTSDTEAFCTWEGCSSVQRGDEWSSTIILCYFTGKYDYIFFKPKKCFGGVAA